MQDEFSKALNFRHACKVFDEDKKISDEDIRYILEAGRLSPSSFGLEGWKFLVITNQDLKAKLRLECWNQVQITSCSHLVVLLAEIEGAKVESKKPRKQLGRRGFSKEKLDGYVKLYEDHLADTLSSDEKIYEWTARQTYIAGANMMMAGAFREIDSCAIEGMNRKRVEDILELDRTKWQVSMLIPFGYRVKKQQDRYRLSFDEVVEFIE